MSEPKQMTPERLVKISSAYRTCDERAGVGDCASCDVGELSDEIHRAWGEIEELKRTREAFDKSLSPIESSDKD